MKDDFLTIPNAPNYEVNSELVVRNKTTGYIKKKRDGVVRLSIKRIGRNAKRIGRSARVCRVAAEKAAGIVENEIWTPVPSLNNQYELSTDGRLRNTKTRYVIKQWDVGQSIHFYIDVERVNTHRTLAPLMREVYGVDIRKGELVSK